MLPSTSRFLKIFLLLTAIMLAGGCANLGYYSQAIVGQLDILARTRPITELLDDGLAAGTGTDVQPLDPSVKARLATVLQVRDFATRTLSLPDNGSYRVYADLDRQPQTHTADSSPGGGGRAHVAWNVIATSEFSLTPKEWCFPFAGCVPYRGYFSRERADQFANDLKQDQLDVRIAGIAAYSTLGWFRDPVFSTQLRRSDTEIAALIFHELAHQKLYLRGDAAFNESFATTVEIEGMRRWLAQGSDPAAAENYLRDLKRRVEFVELLQKYRARLEALYASPLAVEDMRATKARGFEALRAEYALLREHWGGYTGYDAWFAQDLNNAHLASVGLYHLYVPAFQALLAGVHGDLPTFYRLARAFSRLPEAERAAWFARISNGQARLAP